MNRDAINVGIFVGSSRVGNNSAGIAQWVLHHLEMSSRLVAVQMFHPEDLAAVPISTKLPKLVSTYDDYDHPLVQKLSLDVANCQCFVIITPVYNGTYSGQLKGMLDFLYMEYSHKPVLNIVHGGKDTDLVVGELLILEDRLGLRPTVNVPIHDPRDHVTGEKMYSTHSVDPLLHPHNAKMEKGLESLFGAVVLR